jgi:GT2 family glycosyltransferase
LLNSEQNIEVSIIIPSYNRYPLNLFTLYSLENQTFDYSKMEVIFIDDASTDQTQEELGIYQPSYHFRYIRNEQNLGRARVRNLGIQLAKGNILIFLDAEMICEPDFVINHHQYHQENKKAIVTGVMHSKNIISCIFPQTKTSAFEMLAANTNPKITNLIKNYNSSSALPYPLLDKFDISNQSYKDCIIVREGWYQRIVQNYGNDLDGFQFPWMAFLTGNVSITKDFIVEAGMFDEDFIKYGYEDWELGYRLYKMGAKYFAGDNLITYHQEHPIGESKWNEAIENFQLFTSKHKDVEVMILGIELAQITDFYTMNSILYEYNQLIRNNEFKGFKENLVEFLTAINLLLQIDVRHIKILEAAGYGKDKVNKLVKDIQSLKKSNEYINLIEFLEKLIKS